MLPDSPELSNLIASPYLIDGHLDLAMNARAGRDLTLSLSQLRKNDPVTDQTATLTFEELRLASTRLCMGTLFAAPKTHDYSAGYTNAAEARAEALAQLEVYQRWEDEGRIRLLKSREEIAEHLAISNSFSNSFSNSLGVVLLMEGADPISDADDLPFWVNAGVRIIGPAWGATRYAGGTEAAGPLTPLGKELVTGIKELGITLDASHLDDASFWDAVEIGPRMIASHSNSRALVSGNRHLTDDMVKVIADQDGIIGLVFLSKFMKDGWQDGDPKEPLQLLADHATHYANLIGWERVAIGSDMDGGFGAEKTPIGMDEYRHLPQFLELLPPLARAGVAYQNWARWLTTWY